MLLIILLTAIVAVGLVAIALAQPRKLDIPVWSDDVERRLLQQRKIDRSW